MYEHVLYACVIGVDKIFSNSFSTSCMYTHMLNKNALGVKKCEANQKQHASRQVRPKALISVEAKKLATLSKKF